MRQPISKIEKRILAFVTAVAAAGLVTTALLYIRSGKDNSVNAAVTDRFEKSCVAGGYERTNGRYVIDIFIPGRGIDTVENIHQSTYDHITKTLGVC